MSDIGGFHRVGGEDIEIVRRRASSKAECELITSDLGKRGYRAAIHEYGDPGVDPEGYHAEILADRRTLPTKEELASRRESRDKKENSRRRHYRIIWILVWIAAGLGVLCSVFLLGPLLRAVLALF